MGRQQTVNFPVRKCTRQVKSSDKITTKPNLKRASKTSDENYTPTKIQKANNGLRNTCPQNSPLSPHNIRSPLKNQCATVSRTLLFDVNESQNLSMPIQLKKSDAIAYQNAKKALQAVLPEKVVEREKETAEINAFIADHITNRTSGSLYVSGAPGTGKTAVIKNLMSTLQHDKRCCLVYVNCACISNPQAIFDTIIAQLPSHKNKPNKSSQQLIESVLCSAGKMIILLLDEIDQLENRVQHQSLLYTMFEWPSLSASRLILIGIANALDLTQRILPRLNVKASCRPKLLHFLPYNREQLASIITSRLSEVSSEEVMEPAAIQLCARRVAAMSGDVRKALNVCRRAVEMVESEQRKQLQLTCTGETVLKKVTAPLVMRLMCQVYSSPISSTNDRPTVLPLQQKLCLCSLILLLKRDGKGKDVYLGKLYDIYVKVCKLQAISIVDQSEFSAICSFIDNRGLIQFHQAKDTRMSTIRLKADESEVEAALADTVLMTAVLNMAV